MKRKFSYFLIALTCHLLAEDSIDLPEPCECNTSPILITLEYAVNRVLTANRQILTSVNSLQNSQLRLELAYSDFDLKMKPLTKGGYSGGGEAGPGMDLGFGLTWDKKWSPGTKVHISPFVRRLRKDSTIDIEASITQPLFKGFNREYNLSSLRSAEHSARSAIRSLHIAQSNMVMKTITALYDVIKQQKTIEVQKECHRQLLRHYKLMKQKEQRDLTDGGDVFRIESDIKQSEDNIQAAESKLRESQDVVRELLVIDLGTCFEINVPQTFKNVAIDCDEAIRIALAYRTEIEQSSDEYREKSRLSRVAKESLKPDLDAVLKVNNTGYDRYFRDINKKPLTTWTLNLTSSADYERVSEKISYDQSLVAIDSAASALEQTKEKVILEVKRSLRQLTRAAENIKLQESKMISLNGELKLQLRKYEKGQSKNSDIMKTEQSICSTRIAIINATFDQLVGEYSLKAAMGLLIEKPIVNC